MERTFVMLKPDAVERGLVGAVLARLEAKGLRLVAAKTMLIDRRLAEEHYQLHKGKPFFEDLVQFICSGMVLVSVWEGRNAIRAVRQLVGATDPTAAAPGTIRGDFGLEITRNIVHASDSQEASAREIRLFFGDLTR
ncbi:MAG TPA: nucleoside-diphosphate kinase [Firmicutes bacterium]|nr:nucleoside-diphosphate kinase [Bacillota bacterium]